MDESEDNMSSEDIKSNDSSLNVKNKPKKRSLIERELETNLTARITSPVTTADGASTSRYGRARRLKSELDQPDINKVTTELKSPISDKSPTRKNAQSPVNKMHASNSPLKRIESPKIVGEEFLDNQIESIYQENISLSRFSNDNASSPVTSPAKKFPKVYIRKDLIQKREPEETVMVIQNMFSPVKSTRKSSNTHLNNILERSSERYSLNNKSQNILGNSSVVKTLDFDNKKKKTPIKDIKPIPSKSELFELEAKCPYQVGDLAWARMGTYPFWPSIVTRDPLTGTFVKKKLFGRIERDVIHVTFFGDNGRRSWIVDSMLRRYLGQLEFEATRENFTPEARKKDPKLYAAYFVSEKKLPLWTTSVEEAEMLLREPKRLRIDIFNDMLEKFRSSKVKQPRSKTSRTDSDVSLSESLYDSLFSEEDGKSDNTDRSKSRSRKKSLDMFEVVTACLDNMAAKTGMTKIQRQSHMDRWLQKAKSKTPEKTKAKSKEPLKREEKNGTKLPVTKKRISSTPKKTVLRNYSLRNSIESHNISIGTNLSSKDLNSSQETNQICVISKIETLAKKNEDTGVVMLNKESDHSESIKECSQDLSELCESETYTDEFEKSINDANNTTMDEGKSDISVPNSESVSKDFVSETSCSTVNEEKSGISAPSSETVSKDFISESSCFNNLQDSPEIYQIGTQDPADINASNADLITVIEHSNKDEKEINSSQAQSHNYQTQNGADVKKPTEDLNINIEYDSQGRKTLESKRYSTRNMKSKSNEVTDTSYNNVITEVDHIRHTGKDEEKNNTLDSDFHNSPVKKKSYCKTHTEDLNSIVEVKSERQDSVEFKRYSTRNKKSKINEITDTSNSDVLREVTHISHTDKDEIKNNNLNSDSHNSPVQKKGDPKPPTENLNSIPETNFERRNSLELKIYSTRNRKSKNNETIDTQNNVVRKVDHVSYTENNEKEITSCSDLDCNNVQNKKGGNLKMSIEDLNSKVNLNSERQDHVDFKRNTRRNSKSKINEVIDNQPSVVIKELGHIIHTDRTKKEIISSLDSESHGNQIQTKGDLKMLAEDLNSKVEFNSERRDSAEIRRYSTRKSKSKINEIINTQHSINERDGDSISHHTDKDEKEILSSNSDSIDSQIQIIMDLKPSSDYNSKGEISSDGRDFEVKRYSTRNKSKINEIIDNQPSVVIRELDRISHTGKDENEININVDPDRQNDQIQKRRKTPIADRNSKVEFHFEKRDSLEAKRYSTRNNISKNQDIVDNQPSVIIRALNENSHTGKDEKEVSSLDSDSHNNLVQKLKSKVEFNSETSDSVEFKKYSTRNSKSRMNKIIDPQHSNLLKVTSPNKFSHQNTPVKTDMDTAVVETNTQNESQYIKPDKCDIPSMIQKQEENNALSELRNVEKITVDGDTHTTHKNIVETQENQIDHMSLDYDDSDSDSERLPYSPLSNLGNDSDDNLSQDIATLENNVQVSENQSLDTINKETIDDCNRTDLKLKYLKSNITHNEIEEEITPNISKTCEKNMFRNLNSVVTDEITENGHISDNEVQNIAKIENYSRKETKLLDHKVLINGVGDNYTLDSIHNMNNVYREEKVMEIEMASKEIRIYVSDCQKEQLLKENNPAIKENGFHDVNGRIDVETASVHSEDSVFSTKSESGCRLRSKLNKNSEFLKYVEIRQDAIIDENPDLNEDEVVAYLYKTWLYEENAKSDVLKNDDLKDINLVKGLNHLQPETPARLKRNLSLNKHETVKSNTMDRYLRNRKDRIDREISLNKDNEISVTVDKTRRDSPSAVEKDVDLPLFHAAENKGIEDPKKQNEDELNNSVESNAVSDENRDICIGKKELQDPVALEPSIEALQASTNISKELSPVDTKIVQLKEVLTKSSNPIRKSPNVYCEKNKHDIDQDSIDSEDSETPLIRCQLRSKAKKEKEKSNDANIKDEDADTLSLNSEDCEISVTKRKKKLTLKKNDATTDDPEFIKYLELRQDVIVDEHPELTQDEIVTYLYKTWLYEENNKSETKKNDEIQQSSLVKGHKDAVQEPKKVKRKVTKVEKYDVNEDTPTKEKPKRKSVKPFYNEEYSDIEEELEVFEIFKPKNKGGVNSNCQLDQSSAVPQTSQEPIEVYDEVELYFAELTKPKPNVFKGIMRERVCEICEKPGSLVKCKGCNDTFHIDCVKKQVEVVEVQTPSRGRKKKKKTGRNGRPKNSEEFDDDRSQDTIEDNNASVEEIIETDTRAVDEDAFEALLSAKMKEIIDGSEKVDYESYSSDDGLDWNESVPGKCEIVDVKLKPRTSNSESHYSDFKCNNCQQYDPPVCFVCKNAVSKQEVIKRQKCHVAHCNKYYHLQCLDHWPQTQFNGGEPSKTKTNKKINEYFEALMCPRHVCHTCVSDDPRGCKTRFSGDKLARCVKCPATYHSFTKCLPAGTKILTASHIICPRHYEHRSGKVPCHVNTGWCFICALGGSLICCEYCPTSFHAECLNIDPPEGGYMCEDCETGRLPLYGEMVWVKLGHYRWWPGIILHPYEIPENLLAVKHSLGEFVVRFFGQYDHYWVNRGRVFPFQEGDSGRISSQKSKIDAAFTTAMEHAQRACEILKKAQPNEEESLDIASSLLPPHFVRLKVNKPCGSLCGRKLEDPESSLTQCECNPLDDDPCGPYSQCLNRMLLTECGPTCRAGDRCNNRAFEKRLYPKLVPYKTPSRGWGLKTLEDIKSGQFVIEYVGELIDEEEFRRRMRRKHEVRDENFYFLTLDKERMIDAGPKGNFARFMNHCCEPNCETQKWTVLGDVRVGLFALYDIPAQSEVTFNYNLECAGIDKKRCMCGAKRCSGYIGAKPKQDESQTKKNKLHPNKRPHNKKRKPEESPTTKSKQKRPLGRPPKPKELTEIEKDLLIIQNATNSISSDESSRSVVSELDKNPKALKRKRVSFSSEDVTVYDGTESPNVKKSKLDDELKGD